MSVEVKVEVEGFEPLTSRTPYVYCEGARPVRRLWLKKPEIFF
jgi:hypothetical protein